MKKEFKKYTFNELLEKLKQLKKSAGDVEVVIEEYESDGIEMNFYYYDMLDFKIETLKDGTQALVFSKKVDPFNEESMKRFNNRIERYENY